jgi:hypothetical protein
LPAAKRLLRLNTEARSTVSFLGFLYSLTCPVPLRDAAWIAPEESASPVHDFSASPLPSAFSLASYILTTEGRELDARQHSHLRHVSLIWLRDILTCVRFTSTQQRCGFCQHRPQSGVAQKSNFRNLSFMLMIVDHGLAVTERTGKNETLLT